MPKRSDVIAEARRWLGPPFHHQAQTCGLATDCAGLICGVGLALGVMPELSHAERRYGRLPQPERMRGVIAKYLDPIEGEPRPGDVLYMGWSAGRPMHLGILTGLHGRGIIHAFADAGEVVETKFPPHFEALVDSWWKFRGLEE